MITLYQFPISHYCEKIRWVLDYKQLDYTVVNLLVGQHRETILNLAPKSAVPVLVHDAMVVQNSSDIVTYLEATFPGNPLAVDGNDREAVEWERHIDDELGVELRCFWYHHLLQDADAVVPLFTVDGPEEGPSFYKVAFEQLQQRMREFMTINAETAVQAERRLQEGIDRLHDIHQNQPFMMGTRFSRLDIAAAAILSPMALMEMKHGLSAIPHLPHPLQRFVESNRNKTQWIRDLYNKYR